jgi:hypothetical protein
MARKRKNTDDREGRPVKKTKETADDEGDAVNWIIPKAKRKQTADSTHTRMYAERLYARDPETLHSRQNPLQEAQIRTPIFKRQGGRDIGPSDPNRPSAVLCNLFNEIRSASLDESDERYQFASLAQRFPLGDDDTALVLSRAEGNEIFVLNDDRRLEV